MGKREKLLTRLRNNPKGVRFEELDSLLEWYEFERRQSRRGSSHYVYRRGPHVITVVRRKPYVHSKAIKEVLAILDELLEDE
jgi:hypothetical protein